MKVKDIIQEARSPEEFMSQLRSTAPDIKQVYQKYLKSPHYRPFRTSDDSTSEYHNWTDNFAQFLRKEFGHMPQDLAFEIGNHLYDYIKMRNREDPEGVAESGPFSYGAKKPRKGSVADLADKKRQEQERGKQPIEPKDQMIGVAKVTKGVAEGSLNEFAPDSGGGDGRWYTDDEIADIIGEDWFEFDLSGEAANISRHGEHAKILLVQEAQAYFEDRGYHGVTVQDVRDDEDFLSWYISGNFTRLGEGVAEGLTKQARARKEAESVKSAIERLKQQLKDPNPHIDKDDIRRRLETEKRRLELYRDVLDEQDVAEGKHSCPECGGPSYSNPMLAEKKDACYHKVKSRVKVWPSAYASGQLVQCRKRGASNWGTGGKKK